MEWKEIRRSGVEAGRGDGCKARQDKPRQAKSESTRQQVRIVVPVFCCWIFYLLALSHTKICRHYADTIETTIETMWDTIKIV